MVQVAAFGAQPHVVDDRRRSPTSRRTRAGEKIIAATRNTYVDIKMRMHIDTAREYITTTGINDLDVASDLELRTNRGNLPLNNQKIGLARAIGFNNGAVFDESFHTYIQALHLMKWHFRKLSLRTECDQISHPRKYG